MTVSSPHATTDVEATIRAVENAHYKAVFAGRWLLLGFQPTVLPEAAR